MANLRYTVGHQYAFARTRFEGEGYFSRLYVPTKHKLKSIDVVLLYCAEHHRVPDAHDPDQVSRYDGFVFTELKPEAGTTWHNQFPHASYGQTDDSADRRVRRNPVEGELFTDKHMEFYTDAYAMLGQVYNLLHGPEYMRDRMGEFPDSMRQGFEEYLAEFQGKVEELTGNPITYRPTEYKGEFATITMWDAMS